MRFRFLVDSAPGLRVRTEFRLGMEDHRTYPTLVVRPKWPGWGGGRMGMEWERRRWSGSASCGASEKQRMSESDWESGELQTEMSLV